MVKAAAVGGGQAKAALVDTEQGLTLDGAERADDAWRPPRVVPAQPLMDALNEALSRLEPTPSALHQLLNEKLR